PGAPPPAGSAGHHPPPGAQGARRRHPSRVGALVPRLRRPPAVSLVGRDAVGLGPYLHAARAVDGHLARRRDLARGLRLQHARRCAARRPRSATSRRPLTRLTTTAGGSRPVPTATETLSPQPSRATPIQEVWMENGPPDS